MLRQSLAIVFALGFASAGFAANPQVELDTTAGRIRIELYPDAAPKTVANFIDYVKAKHYDGTQFHRVIDGFMIQGGGFTPEFRQKPTRPPIVNEAEMSSKAGILNKPGTIAMARTSDPNSATAQFFINVNDNKFLNFRSPDPQGIGYTAFGRSCPAWTSSPRSPRRPRAAARVCPRARRCHRATFRPNRSSSTRRRSSTRPPRSRSDPMTKVRLTTSKGPIVLELDDENAPATVKNFLQYVRDGHYDNTVFHRVIDGFMIQGGGMGRA